MVIRMFSRATGAATDRGIRRGESAALAAFCGAVYLAAVLLILSVEFLLH
jgi:hypothetical protein